MFVLTTEEKRVVCFIMLAILIGLAVKEYRREHPANNATQPGFKQLLKKQPDSTARPDRFPVPPPTAP